ncbi:MAG: hypothetical protein HUJ29_02405 [Gammaproteobacteria bacterium]|nr:hypothetical protein [Gammaproteobacteria bacterium]
MAQTVKTFKYMQNFQCVGSECINTCCRGWDIHVDKEHYKKIKGKLSETADGKDLLNRSFRKNRSASKAGGKLYKIEMDETASCPLMDTQGLCRLHADYGESYLPNTCAIYPRQLSVYRDQWELTGYLSCPEVARLCLFDDDSFALVDTTIDSVPRKQAAINQNIAANTLMPFYKHFGSVRDMMFNYLSLRDLPLRSRLFILAFVANKLDPLIGQKGSTYQETEYQQILDAYTQEQQIQKLHQSFQGLDDVSRSFGAQLLGVILRIRAAADFKTSTLSQLICDITEDIGLCDDDVSDDAALDEITQALLDKYQLLASVQDSELNRRFDLALENYLKNFLYSNYYILSKMSLAEYVHMLILQTTMLRFLVYSHPQLLAKRDALSDMNETDKRVLIDQTIIDVFHKFSRGINHAPEFMRTIQQIFIQNNLNSLAHTSYLIMF